MNRRRIIEGASLGATGAVLAGRFWPKPGLPRRTQKSTVAIIRCESYERCHVAVEDGIRLLVPAVRGKRVLLKPNLVEYSTKAAINTHPNVIAATADSLFRLGASEVIVGDGPGHVRDSEMLIDECGLRSKLAEVGRVRFVDLNFDAVRRISPRGGFTSFRELWLPETVLSADVIISMPKIKTHHWAGVTLSLKNLFGCIPGNVYGWPKNVLHWEGIDNSIAELAATIPIHYVIADGIVAMEGNGPLHGPSRHLSCLVFADDPVAADATCCGLMGIDPSRVRHLTIAAPIGNASPGGIIQIGEPTPTARQRFSLMPEFGHIAAR
jgi:uncharacterized protein (DUF362 family)